VPQVVIDDFSNAAAWTALDPVSAPSAEIVLANDPVHGGDLPDATSLRLQISSAADGHFITRALGPLNLSTLQELRFWVRAALASDGSPARPFRLRFELGSVALPITAPGNTWHRYLPAFQANTWQFVQLSLDDLPAAVAGAVTEVRITCVNTTASYTAWLDDLIACRTEVIADVDAALLSLLDGVLNLGALVPARVHINGAVAPAEPWIRLVHYEASYSDIRTIGRRPRTDFSDAGYRVRPETVAYDLFYRIEGATADRAEQTAMLEFVMDTLGHRRGLLVNGILLQLDRVPDLPVVDDMPTVVGLCYRVGAHQERGPHQHVLPALETRVTADLRP
jgi:hypothetical protein